MPIRKTPIPAHARCLICGTGLSVPVFDCPECATPHHSSCWQWSGGCAVYGCRRAARQPRDGLRDAELSAIEAALRCLPEPVRAPVHEPARRANQSREPVGAGEALLEWVRGAAVIAMMAIAAAGSSRPPSQPRPVYQVQVGPRTWIQFTSPSQSMSVSAEDERVAEALIRDDSEWEGAGTDPGPRLRRMMVAREGGALRSGVSRLATRPLPDWVRARVQALERTAPGGSDLPLLASRRP